MANGVKVTPLITSRGLFEVQKPFYVNPRTVYEVTALREFHDLETSFVDVYDTYYRPYGLDESTYSRDRNLNACIVTLTGPSGNIYVPDTFIISYPEQGYGNYQHVVLSVSLGAVNKNRNIESLKKDIASLVESHMGIKPEVRTHIAPTTDALTDAEAKSLEKLRNGNKSITESAYELWLREKKKTEALTQRTNSILLNMKAGGYVIGTKAPIPTDGLNKNKNDVDIDVYTVRKD